MVLLTNPLAFQEIKGTMVRCLDDDQSDISTRQIRGRMRAYISCAARCLAGVSIGIGLLVLLNQLKIPYYLYYPTTARTVLISDSIDVYLFLASSVCVPMFAFVSHKLSRLGTGILTVWVVSLVLVIFSEPYAIPILYVTVISAAVVNVSGHEWQRLAADLIISMITIVALIEFSAVYYWVNAALNPLGMVGVLSEQLELSLTYSLYPAVMLMMFLLLFAWLWVPTISGFPRLRPEMIREKELTVWNKRLVVAALDLCAILSLLVFFYPYLAGQTWVVGVDSLMRYLDPLNGLVGLSPSQAIVTSYQHGAYLMLLYLIERTTGISSFAIVKFAPLMLAFAMGSTVFLMMLRTGWGFEIAVLSLICALFWVPTTLGFFTGIQANWIAFVFWMLFLSQYFRERSAGTFVSQGLISLVILVMHPWTWGVFLATILLTAIISWRSKWSKVCLQGALAAVVFAVPAGLVAYQFVPGMRSDLVSTLNLYSLSLQEAGLVSWGGAYIQFFRDWGPFLSPLLLVICLVGAYSLAGREGIAKNYVMAWIAVWCIASILVAPTAYIPGNVASETQLWRMFYISPLPILLALGMEKLLRVRKFPELYLQGVISRKLIMLIYAVLIPASMGLFFFSNPFARLAMLLIDVASMFLLTIQFPKRQVLRILVLSVLVLVLVNVGYRSLYPLIISPHNLIPPSQAGR